MSFKTDRIFQDYLACKEIICNRRTEQCEPLEQRRAAILADERAALMAQNPSRSLRLYPFEHKARENAEKRTDFQETETMLAVYWSFYFSHRADMMDNTLGALRRNGGKTTAFILELTENIGARVARMGDPVIDRGWALYRDCRKGQQPA